MEPCAAGDRCLLQRGASRAHTCPDCNRCIQAIWIRQLWRIHISNPYTDLIYKSVIFDGFLYRIRYQIRQLCRIHILNPYTMTGWIHQSVIYDGFLFWIRIRIRYINPSSLTDLHIKSDIESVKYDGFIFWIRIRLRIQYTNPSTMTNSYFESVYGFDI